MKRITWWPQAWLGLVFSWAALVGWSGRSLGALDAARAAALRRVDRWVIGYDTIYALQDVEDDALVGVRSSARALGAPRAGRGRDLLRRSRSHCGARRSGSLRPDPLALAALLPAALHFAWQVATLAPADGANALAPLPLEPLRRPADVPRLPGRRPNQLLTFALRAT